MPSLEDGGLAAEKVEEVPLKALEKPRLWSSEKKCYPQSYECYPAKDNLLLSSKHSRIVNNLKGQKTDDCYSDNQKMGEVADQSSLAEYSSWVYIRSPRLHLPQL